MSNKIGNAPSGQKTVLDGTEKLPISGSQYVTSQAVANLGVLYASYANNSVTPDTVTDGNVLTLTIDTEVVDVSGLASLGSNVITFAKSGNYLVFIGAQLTNAGTFDNGSIIFSGEFSGDSPSIYYAVPTTTDMVVIDNGIQIYMFGFLQVDAGDTLSVTLFNDSGVSIVGWIKDVSLLKLG